jgi:cyanate permease
MTDDETVTRRGYLLLALGSLGYACFTFAWFVVPAFLQPIVRELGLSSTMAGLVTGAIPLTYVPLALVSGLVVDRIGPGRAIGIGLFVLGSAAALRSTADGFLALFLATALVGVGGTGVTFGLPKLVSVVVPTGRTGTATSAYIVGASAGTAAAFSVGRPVLGPVLGGWRPVLLWSGLAVVAFAVVWSAVARTAEA